MNLRIHIDSDSPVPIYLQIVQQVRARISTGELAEGILLPPERTLARELRVELRLPTI